MKLSPNTRYAIRVLFELDGSSIPLSIATLSYKTGISLRTVENVHTVLKQKGITDAIVGAKGGLLLKKPLEDIRLGHVVEWFDDGVEFAVCCGDKANECPQRHKCATRSLWRRISDNVQGALNSIALTEIGDQLPGNSPL